MAQSDQSYVKNLIRDQICINIPSYSTRTHTIILVDAKNRVTFNEKTMRFPIEADKTPVWTENTFEFDLLPVGGDFASNSKLS